MASTKSDHPAKTLWAYAYQVVPPQSGRRLDTIKALLDLEHANARRTARTWVGRLVLEPRFTNILVVSDNPAQDLEIHGKLADAFEELNVVFSISVPMAVAAVTTGPKRAA